MSDQCFVSGSSRKNGRTWWDRHGNEWQRYWCGNENHRNCRTSIPVKTGKTRPVKGK